MRSLFLVPLVGLLLISVASADIVREVRTLARDLDATEAAKRDQAEKKLLEIGPVALPHLPKPRSRMSREMILRLNRVRAELERRQAEAATEARTVSLTGKMKLSAALRAIEAQTGNKIIDYREEFDQPITDPEMDLSLKDVSFWQAIDTIVAQASLAVYPYAQTDDGSPLAAVALVDQSGQGFESIGQVSYSGPVRLEATEVIARRRLGAAGAGALSIQVRSMWEPRLRPITLSLPVNSLVGTDDQGHQHRLSAGDGAGPSIEIDTDSTVAEFHLPLALPARDATRLVKLSGSLDALLAGKVAEFRFDKLSEGEINKKMSEGGVEVTIESIRQNNALWEFRVKVKFKETAGALESHLGLPMHIVPHLETKDGEEIEIGSSFNTFEEPDSNEFGMAYLFALDAPLAQHVLVYRTPAALLQKKIDFEFTDLPLP